MSEQQKNEIIKSLAYDISIEEIAEDEDMEVSEIEQIQIDYAQDIKDEMEYLKEMEMM